MKRWRISAKRRKLYKKSKENARYRNIILEMKYSCDELKNRLVTTEENNSELENTLTEIIQAET